LIARAFSLAERGALYSARSEFYQALRTITKALDANRGEPSYTQALVDGLQALKEAEDFVGRSTPLPADVDVASVVATHRTPVLKGYDTSTSPAVLAMQHYYTYAQEQLAQACAGAPVASRALYGIGKVHTTLGETSSREKKNHGTKAMAFYQAALLVDANNYRASNELGVLFARFGQLHEASHLLRRSVAIHPQPETWHNLAVVHERLGEFHLASLAQYEWQRSRQAYSLANTNRQGGALVEWVAPSAFARTAPTNPPTAMPFRPQPRMANHPPSSWYR
jgi:tetratricopeptide (TPR) repeat protein